MPTHQTKLMMSKAQATGELLPQTPTPETSRYKMVKAKRPEPQKVSRKRRFQTGFFPGRTWAKSDSFSDRSSCFPTISGLTSALMIFPLAGFECARGTRFAAAFPDRATSRSGARLGEASSPARPDH